MNCRTCSYPLWNLRDRLCPECGTPFRPSEFRFVAGSVRFCCPHCDQAYYGTSPEGHLQPPAFQCVSCQQFLRMDEMVLLPTEGIAEEGTAAETMPWIDPRRGVVSRWFATMGWAMTTPAKLIRLTPEHSSTWRAFSFFALSSFFFQVALWMPFVILFGILGFFTPGQRGGGLLMGTMMAMPIAVLFVGTMVTFLLWLVVSHGLLRLGGRLPSSVGRTAQCFFYSGGTNILTVVPCVGFYFAAVSWVWPAVSAILMIRQSQKVSGLRASFAVLTPPLLVVGAIVAWIVFAMIPSVQQSMVRAQAVVAAQQQLQAKGIINTHAQEVLTALKARAADPPRHAARLVADGDVASPQLILSDFGDPGSVPIGRLNLRSLDSSPKTLREQELKRVEAAMGSAPVHRLGDFVFTYQGINMGADPPYLWLFIAEVAGGPAESAKTDLWIVGLNSGNLHAIAPADLQTELKGQNAVRRARGLPAIPHPSTVKHVIPPASSAPSAAGGD